MIKLLYIEDDRQLTYVMKYGLEHAIGGYGVVTAKNGVEGLKKWAEECPDVIVVDIEMPEMDGFEMAKKIRRRDRKTPIVFASGLVEPDDVVGGYQIGGNMYIKKPYNVEELDAHIKALLKTAKGLVDDAPAVQIGSYWFDASNLEIGNPDGTLTALSPREGCILQMLCENKNKVVQRNDILERFWTEATLYTSRSLDVFVSKLRGKFKQDSRVEIVTVKGVGLKLVC